MPQLLPKTHRLSEYPRAYLPFLVGLVCLATPAPLYAMTLGQNLIVNGDAEQGLGDPVGDAVGAAIPTIPGWTPSASFSTLQYGASGFSFTNPAGQLVQVSGLPNAAMPGPTDRGKNLFYGGGSRASSSATQSIDLSNLAETIDAGSIGFTLSGWMGGYQTDRDSASLTVSFLSESGILLGSSSIAAPTPEERNNVTGLFFQSADGLVPVGTRQADILLNMNYTRGRVNDAYADNLSLTTKTVAEPAMTVGISVVGLLATAHRKKRSQH